MTRLHILLVDDHEVVRLGLRTLLQSEPDLEVVAEAGTADEAVQAAVSHLPQVVLMDIRLPDRSGIEACREIRQRCPTVQELMLTSYGDEDLVTEAVAAGAAGYVLKQLSTDDLLEAIRSVGRGDAFLDPKVTKKLLSRIQRAELTTDAAAFRDLSERELQVLALVAQGKSNAEIAQELVLSPLTVRNHVSTILSKLGLSNRIEAAIYAVRHHIDCFV